MSHFSLETELSNVLKMDGPLNRGLSAGFPRKQRDDTSQSVNMSLNVSCGPGKTPVKNVCNNKSLSKTPSSNGSLSHKTPKSGGK